MGEYRPTSYFRHALVELASNNSEVVVQLNSGVVLQSTIELVGSDYIKLDDGQYVPLSAIDLVQDGVDEEEFDPSDPCCQSCVERESCEQEWGQDHG